VSTRFKWSFADLVDTEHRLMADMA
jgi:hypothetical protein